MGEKFINADYIVSGSITSPNSVTTSDSVREGESKTFFPGGGEISVKVDIPEQDICKLMWDFYGDQVKQILTPHRIIHNRKTDETIVIWKDGTKTKVKLMEGEKSSPYTAYTAALAKRIYGSNTQVSKIVSMTIEPEKRSGMCNQRNSKKQAMHLLEVVEKLKEKENMERIAEMMGDGK